MHISFPRTFLALVVCSLVACLAIQFGYLPLSVSAAVEKAGYSDFAFDSSVGDTATADKPQSKLWFNDGFWWAVLFHSASKTYHIYKLNWPATWVDTGTVVDNRILSRADCLWDGTHLYVASSISSNDAKVTNEGRLYRYSYDTSTDSYSLDAGFPAIMMTGLAETIVMDKDSTGQLWVTYTQNSKVYVNRSTTDDATWGTPFVLPMTEANVFPDDISTLVSYSINGNGNIGVLWSSHNTNPITDPNAAMYFAWHKDNDADDVWQPAQAIYKGACIADDHLNIKSFQADQSGQLYAAIKTSYADNIKDCGGGTNPPQLRLAVRKADGRWTVTTFGTRADDHTRPIVLLDQTHRTVYMFATSPTSCGVIYMKQTSMDNPSFATGKGTAFISSNTYKCINNATSTKQTLSASTGLVVLASDEKAFMYLHNVIDLAAIPTLTPSQTNTPTQTSTPTQTATASQTSTPTQTATTSHTSTPTRTVVASHTSTPTATTGLTGQGATPTRTPATATPLGPSHLSTLYLPIVRAHP